MDATARPQLKKQPTATGHGGAWRLQAPYSTKLTGMIALLVSTGILLLLSGITVTAAVLGLIFVSPIIIITSPIWVPTGIFCLLVVAVVLSLCGLGLAGAAALYWLSKYI